MGCAPAVSSSGQWATGVGRRPVAAASARSRSGLARRIAFAMVVDLEGGEAHRRRRARRRGTTRSRRRRRRSGRAGGCPRCRRCREGRGRSFLVPAKRGRSGELRVPPAEARSATALQGAAVHAEVPSQSMKRCGYNRSAGDRIDPKSELDWQSVNHFTNYGFIIYTQPFYHYHCQREVGVDQTHHLYKGRPLSVSTAFSERCPRLGEGVICSTITRLVYT